MWKVSLLSLTIACKDKINLPGNLACWSKCLNKNKYMHNILLANVLLILLKLAVGLSRTKATK